MSDVKTQGMSRPAELYVMLDRCSIHNGRPLLAGFIVHVRRKICLRHVLSADRCGFPPFSRN